MRRILVCCFVISCISSLCYAAPIYGPRMPGKGKLHIGGQTHSVLEKELEGENGEMTSLQHFLQFSYGVTDWLSLDLKGGAGSIRQKPDVGDEIAYPAYMAGGYGFRIKLYDKDKITAVCGFQHISVHPYSIWFGNDKYKAVLDDWQWSALVAYEFPYITPYLGVNGARMDYIYWVNDDRNRVKSQENKPVGLVVGANISVDERIWLNVEGHFLDAEAITASVNYQF